MKKYRGDEINQILPMRYPYMILDILSVEEGEWAEAEIDLKEKDWFFECHFPAILSCRISVIRVYGTGAFIYVYWTCGVIVWKGSSYDGN